MCQDDTKKPIYLASSGVYCARFNPSGETDHDINEMPLSTKPYGGNRMRIMHQSKQFNPPPKLR